MDGLIIVNKEKNMTSHDVVSIARRILHTKRIGHTGTLDPNATGVLVLCVNEATKLVPYLETASKTYYAEIILGLKTDTFDITGNVIEKKTIDIDENKLKEVLNSFIGEYDQVPPIYSSIKVNGKKLYQYARNNEQVEIKPRKVTINSLLYNNDLEFVDGVYKFHILVDVSKGTYIRSLANDIGTRLNVPSCMGNLERRRVGNFHLSSSVTLKELEEGKIQYIDMLDALDYPIVKAEDTNFVKEISNGMKLDQELILKILKSTPEYITITLDNKLKAIYFLDGNIYRVARLWM